METAGVRHLLHQFSEDLSCPVEFLAPQEFQGILFLEGPEDRVRVGQNLQALGAGIGPPLLFQVPFIIYIEEFEAEESPHQGQPAGHGLGAAGDIDGDVGPPSPLLPDLLHYLVNGPGIRLLDQPFVPPGGG